jgi:hypothetical protein
MGSLQGIITQTPQVSILDLRISFANAKCQDPRDRIYAVSDMLYDSHKLACPLPNYNLSFVEVYQQVVLGWLHTFKTLEVLRSCELHTNSPSPSWAPDWSREATRSMKDRPLLASSKLGSWHAFPRDRVLRVTGKSSTALINEVQDITFSTNCYSSEIYRWVHTVLVGQDLSAKYVNGDTVLEAYARTFVCDRLYDQVNPSSIDYPTLEATKHATLSIQSEPQFTRHRFNWGTSGSKFLSVASSLRGKTFIKCEGGYIGTAPPTALPGDQVCILLGCNAPMVLRPTESGSYIVVGECFVHGLSKGEALFGALPNNIHVARVIDKGAGGYVSGFVDELTSTVSFLDPRLEALPLDLKEYKQALSRNGNARVSIKPELLEELGVSIKYFDLI